MSLEIPTSDSHKPHEPVERPTDELASAGEVSPDQLEQLQELNEALEAPFVVAKKQVRRERLVRGLGIGAMTLGVGLSALGVVKAIENTTPHPKVDGKTSTKLISINDRLQSDGQDIAIGGASLFAGGYLLRRVNRRFDANLRATDRNKTTRRIGTGLTMLVVASAGGSSALGLAASEGASVPVDTVANAAAPNNPAGVEFILQHDHALPFDHSEIGALQTYALANAIKTVGDGNAKLMPYSFILGDARHVDSSLHNPSSAAITLLPSDKINQIFGTSLPAVTRINEDGQTVQDCDNNSAIVNAQFDPTINGKLQENQVIVEGKKVNVAKTFEAFPGLDRAAVVESLEQQLGCITSKDILTGAAVSGLSHAQVQQVLKEAGLDYTAIDYKTYKQEYVDFWKASVDPVEMQQLLLVFILSFTSLSAMKLIDIRTRRHALVAEDRSGVSRGTMMRREFSRSGAESVKAGFIGAIPTLGIVAMNNSAQLGLAENFNMHTLGAGFATAASANMLAALFGAAYIRRMRMTKVERD